MMKKKISILTLTFLFLVSTTGFPVTYHLCRMMQEKSFSKCEMCKAEMEEIQTSCHYENTSDYSIVIKSENLPCCEEEFVYNKVEAEFVINKTEVKFFSSSEILFQPIILIPNNFDFSVEESFYCDSSPPFLVNPEIYITNSILLI